MSEENQIAVVEATPEEAQDLVDAQVPAESVGVIHFDADGNPIYVQQEEDINGASETNEVQADSEATESADQPA